MDKLLPCPFCGGEIEYLRADHKNLTLRSHQFICYNCNTQTFKKVIGRYISAIDTEKEAITAWNKRYETPKED